MSLGILDVSHTSDDDSLGKPGPLPEMKPLGRAESFFRWLLFIPCALIAFVAAYYTVTTMGLAGWEKLFHHPASYPNKSSTFHLLYHSLAAGLAGFMGVSLGALAAPAHRGVAGLVLLALLGLGVLVCAVAVGSGDSHQLIWILNQIAFTRPVLISNPLGGTRHFCIVAVTFGISGIILFSAQDPQPHKKIINKIQDLPAGCGASFFS